MNAQVQILEKDGKPTFAVIPVEDYRKLLELAEDAEDIDAANAVMARDEESIPHELMMHLLEGEQHPLRIWREYRGLTQDILASNAGVGKSYISQIEARKKTGSVAVLAKLATALKIDIDDLIANEIDN